MVFQKFAVARTDFTAFLYFFIKPGPLAQDNGRLQRIEASVRAYQCVMMPPHPSVRADGADLFG